MSKIIFCNDREKEIYNEVIKIEEKIIDFLKKDSENCVVFYCGLNEIQSYLIKTFPKRFSDRIINVSCRNIRKELINLRYISKEYRKHCLVFNTTIQSYNYINYKEIDINQLNCV